MDLGVNLGVALLQVSETGALLVLRAALEPRQEVTLLLEGRGHLRPVRIPGIVVWCSPAPDDPSSGTFRVGVEFQKRLPWADLMHIS
jgi:hypothetical protein